MLGTMKEVGQEGLQNLEHYIHYSRRGMSKEEFKASSADHVKGKQ